MTMKELKFDIGHDRLSEERAVEELGKPCKVVARKDFPDYMVTLTSKPNADALKKRKTYYLKLI